MTRYYILKLEQASAPPSEHLPNLENLNL